MFSVRSAVVMFIVMMNNHSCHDLSCIVACPLGWLVLLWFLGCTRDNCQAMFVEVLLDCVSVDASWEVQFNAHDFAPIPVKVKPVLGLFL